MALAQRNNMSVTATQHQTGIASLDRFLEHSSTPEISRMYSITLSMAPSLF